MSKSSDFRNTVLIAKREYLAFVRTIGFWLSLLTLPLLMISSLFVPLVISQSQTPNYVAVLDLTNKDLATPIKAMIEAHDTSKNPELKLPQNLQNNPSVRSFLKNAKQKRGIRLVDLPQELDPRLDRATNEAKINQLLLKPDANPSTILMAYDDNGAVKYRIWSTTAKKGDLQGFIGNDLDEMQFQTLAKSHNIDANLAHELYATHAIIENVTPSLNAKPSKTSRIGEDIKANGPRFFGIFMSYAGWIAIFSSSMILLTGVIEEKSSKVLEVLLASTSTMSLLLGKVIGVALVMLTVLLIWGSALGVVVSYGVALLPPQASQAIAGFLQNLLQPWQVIMLILYFVGGYLMYGITFTAIGSFCETQKDAQAIMGPIMVVLMIPMFAIQAAMVSPDITIIKYLSYFPLFTPFLMPLRIAQALPWWEFALTLMGMALTAALMIKIGGRAFRQGALTGGKFNLMSLFKHKANI